MKSIILTAIGAAMITQSCGCDVLKKLTGKSWHEYPVGTKRVMIIVAIWGLMILTLIAIDIFTAPKRK